MKTLTKKIQTYINDNTPFRVIDLPNHTIKLWWSKKGTNGYQCIVVLYHNKGGEHTYFKTGGFGYCKESSALKQAFKVVGNAPKEMASQYKRYLEPSLPFCYHVGGNYYKVPKSEMRVIK